jgi:hypothetical protein
MAGKSKTPVRSGLPRKRVTVAELVSTGTGGLVSSFSVGVPAASVPVGTESFDPHDVINRPSTNVSLINAETLFGLLFFRSRLNGVTFAPAFPEITFIWKRCQEFKTDSSWNQHTREGFNLSTISPLFS